MGTANTVCQDWRWAQDTSARNWIQALHTNLASPASWLDTNIRLRVLIEDTGSKEETDGYVLQYTINGGTNWYDVTNATNYVRSSTSAFITDGDPTSQEIGSGTFDEGYYDTTGAIASYTLATGQQSEHEFNFQFRSADVAGLTVGLRIAFSGGSGLDGYTYSNPSTTFPTGVFQQSHVRVRYDLDSLNSESSGWIGALDANVEVDAEKVFRIRFEVEEINSLGKTATLKLQYRKNGGSWADLTYQPFDYTATAVPDCHITATSLYVDGDATTNLLSGSSKTFVAGSGQEDNTLPSLTLNNQHTEYEFALVFHKFYDGPAHNADGTTFEFRLVESSGTVLGGTYVIPVITMNHPPGLIGGCFTESPGKIMAVDDNGNIYVVLEPTHNTPYNLMMMVKSEDGGDTWAEVDGANRPTSDDLEAVDIRLVGDVIHIIHHSSTTVVYHQFAVSTHSTNPDEWLVTDQSVATGVTYDEQFAALEVFDDGRVLAMWTNIVTLQGIYYKIRSTGGTWGSVGELDATASVMFSGMQCIRRVNTDIVDVFYLDYTNRDIYYVPFLGSTELPGSRSLITADSMAANDDSAFTTAVAWLDGSNDKSMLAYVKATDTKMYSKIVTDGTPGSEQAASDNVVQVDVGGSRQAVADIANDGSTVYLLYSDGPTDDLWMDSNANGAGWGTDSEIEDGVYCNWVRSLVFTHSAGNGGAKVLGYVIHYDTFGGTGPTYYGEIELSSSSTQYGSVSLAKIATVAGTGGAQSLGQASLVGIKAIGGSALCQAIASGSLTQALAVAQGGGAAAGGATSLAVQKAATPGQDASALGLAALSMVVEVVSQALAGAVGDVAYGAVREVSQSGQAQTYTDVDLGLIRAILMAGIGVGEVTLDLSLQYLMALGASSATLSSILLDVSRAIVQVGQVQSLGSDVLDRDLGVSVQGLSQALSDTSLAKELGTAWDGILAVLVDVAIARAASVSSAGLSGSAGTTSLARDLEFSSLGSASMPVSFMLEASRLLSQAASAGAGGNISLAHSESFVAFGFQAVLADMALSRIATVALAGMAESNADIALSRDQMLNQVGDAASYAANTMLMIRTISGAGSVSASSSIITALVNALDPSAFSAASGSMTSARSLGLSQDAFAAFYATLITSLLRALSVTGTQSGGGTQVASLALARSLDIAQGGLAQTVAEWTENLVRMVETLAGATAAADLVTIMALAIAAIGKTQIAVTMTLDRSAELSLGATADGFVSLVLPVSHDAEAVSGAQAGAAVALTVEQALTILSSAATASGISINVIRAIQLSGIEVQAWIRSVLRTYQVLAEPRVRAVPMESRTFVVLPETRTLVV